MSYLIRISGETIITILFFLCISCSEKKQTLDKNAKDINRESTIAESFGVPQKAAHLDTLDRYVSQINFSDCNSIENELRMVHIRDQQYRDSIHSKPNPYSDSNRNRLSYFTAKMKKMDEINEEIVWQILKRTGWTDTCEMEPDVHMGIWYTIIHSNNAKFKLNSLKYVRSAFEDSVLTSEFYAYLIDDIYVNNDKKQIYGTYPRLGDYEEFPYRISKSIDSVNLERQLIGLEPLIIDGH